MIGRIEKAHRRSRDGIDNEMIQIFMIVGMILELMCGLGEVFVGFKQSFVNHDRQAS